MSMAFRGEASYTGLAGGRVRLGNVVVPRRATWTFTGENGEPDLAAHFEIRDGRPECVRFVIEAKKDGRGLRTADLAVLNVDELARGAYEGLALKIADEGDGWVAAEPIESSADVQEARREVHKAQRGRPAGPPKVELQRVAEVYRAHMDSASPTQAVQLHCGYGSHRTAARRVEQARAAGLLPPTTPGKRKG
jgi:hypothetical protein